MKSGISNTGASETGTSNTGISKTGAGKTGTNNTGTNKTSTNKTGTSETSTSTSTTRTSTSTSTSKTRTSRTAARTAARTAMGALVIGIASVTLLSGCFASNDKTSADPTGGETTPASSAPSVTPSEQPTTPPSTPTPTPTPTAPADANVLFTISATAVAPNGAKVDLVQTVSKPVTTTPAMASDKALLDKQCGGWQTTYPAAKFLTAEISSKLQAGSVAWPKNSQVGVDMNGYPGWSGTYSGFQALCATVIVGIGGHIHGVVPVPAANSADAKNGWARIEFGFATISGNPDDGTPKPGELHLTNCAIALSDTAKTSSAIAPKWATQVQQYPGGTCRFGAGF